MKFGEWVTYVSEYSSSKVGMLGLWFRVTVMELYCILVVKFKVCCYVDWLHICTLAHVW